MTDFEATKLKPKRNVCFSVIGSLKDVLENDAIQLDWNFRMSLIHDIVKVGEILLKKSHLVLKLIIV